MRTKTKITILTMLEGEKTCWEVKIRLLAAYFQSEGQDDEVKYAIARFYAQNITHYILHHAEEKIDDIREELDNFFYQSIYRRKVAKEFYYKILRDSNLHDAGVRAFIRMGFYLGRASFAEMLKDKPQFVINKANLKHEEEKNNLYSYVSKNPKIFSNIHSPDFIKRSFQGYKWALILAVLVYVLCAMRDISLANTMIYCLVTMVVGPVLIHLPHVRSVRQSSMNAVTNNLNMSLKIRNDYYFDKTIHHEHQKKGQLSNQQSSIHNADSQPILILENSNNHQAVESQDAAPVITKQNKRRHKTQDEVAQNEKLDVATASVSEQIKPGLFGMEYEYLKAKHIVKVEGKGAGLGRQSQRYLIWHRRSIKVNIKFRDQENYAHLKELFPQIGTAAPRGDYGLKYISIFNIYELKGKGKARIFSDGEEKRSDEKSAVVLAHYIRNGFH